MIEDVLAYLRLGLSVIPCGFRDKRPLIRWEEYQHRLPTEDEVRQWFSDGKKNVAIICGRVSGNLVVLDFEENAAFAEFINALPEDLLDKIKDTWLVKTYRGYHLYLRVTSSDPVKTTKLGKCDIRAEGSYVIAPPSVHPEGVSYLLVKGTKIADVSEEDFSRILRILEDLFGKTAAGDEVKVEGTRKLTEDQLNRLVNLFSPYWVEGRRHYLALMIAGALYWHGYTLNDAIAVVETICKVKKDPEIKDRIRAVRDTFERGAREIPIAYKALHDEAGIPEDQFVKLSEQLLDIIKGDFVIASRRFVVRKGENVLYVVDYRLKIIKEVYINKNNEYKVRDTIATAIPVDVTVIRSEDAELLKVTFEAMDGFRLTLEGDIDEVVTQLKKQTLRVTSRRKIEDALSLIISKMIKVGMCKIQEGERVQGVFLNGDGLKAIDYETDMPSREEVRGALELLDKFVEMSKFNPRRVGKLACVVRWFVSSGFYWCFKQKGMWMPHLYLFGESDTGKTKTCQFLANIWVETPSGSLGTIDSPFRFGQTVSKTTFPVIVNEMNFDELSGEVLEMWKNAVDGEVVRSRYGKKVKAYAPLAFTSNSSVPVDRAIKKRLVLINFDVTDADRLVGQKQEFESLFVQRGKLNAIGRFAFNFVKENPDVLEVGWEVLAVSILKACYRYAELEIPDWIELKDPDVEENPTEVKREIIRAVIYERLVREGLLDKCSIADLEYTLLENVLAKIPWLVLRPRDGSVVIRRGILDELRSKKIRLSSLRDLQVYIPNSRYEEKVKARDGMLSGIVVDLHDFLQWLGLVEEENVESEEEEPPSDWSLERILLDR